MDPLDYQATERQICIGQLGPVHYALIGTRLSRHSDE